MVTVVGMSRHTAVTMVAEGIRKSNVVADLKALDILSDFFDDSRTFVAQNKGRGNGNALGTPEFVGVAYSACDDLYKQLVGRGLDKVYVLKNKRPVLFMHYGGFDFHFTFTPLQ